jgi:hypothetical protein
MTAQVNRVATWGQHVVFFASCYIKINLCCSLFTLRLLPNNYTFLVCNSVHKTVLRIITPKTAFLSVWKFCVITSDEVLREMTGYLMMGLPLRPTEALKTATTETNHCL